MEPRLLLYFKQYILGDRTDGNKQKEDERGSWCSSTRYIEVSNDECTPTGYEEFAPDFTENDPLIPYTKAEELMEKLRKEKMKDD